MAQPEKNKMAKPKPGPATQHYLDISEIVSDMVIMKDGTVRAVLLVSSINFALKSIEEQEATIQAYMTFLNSLEYPVQIVIQSRKMNIDDYILSLTKHQRETKNDLLRAQIADYRNFITEMVELGEIMQKRFYMVIQYDPVTNKRKNFFSRLGEAVSPASAAKLNAKQMADRIEQISRRVDITLGMISSMGLDAVRLDTQALIELYYTVYNPDVFASEPLTDVGNIRHEG